MMKPYIDIRGTHPVLFIGFRAFMLENQPKSITVEKAMDLVQARIAVESKNNGSV